MKKYFKKGTALLLTMMMLCLMLAGCGGSSDNGDSSSSSNGDQIVWNYASCFAEGSNYNQMIEVPMIEKLEEMTDGRITMKIYPSGTVASWGTAMQAVLDGACDIAYDVPQIYKGVYPYTEAFVVPGYICEGSKAGTKLYNDYIEKWCPDEFSDFKLVSFYNAGNIGFYSKTPLNTLDDFKGKTGGMDSEISDTLNVEGLAPVATDASQIYEQLKMGTLDFGAAGLYADIDFHYDEVCDNFTLLPLGGYTGCIVLNKDKYNELDDELKAIVDEWCEYVTEEITGPYTDKLCEMSEDYLAENAPDFTITTLDEGDYDQIIENGKAYQKKHYEEAGLDYAAWEWLVENAPKYTND